MLARPWRIAHRGASAYAPEHTRPAFKMAVEFQVEMIELDVHLSADRELIVIHDPTLERTTNGRGAVRDHSLAELKRLDCGSWFAATYAGAEILTLAEVITLLPGEVRLNAEIKSPEEDWVATADALVCLLAQSQRLADTIISSFLLGALDAVRRRSAEARIGVLWHQIDVEPAFAESQALRATALHPFWPLVDAALVERARLAGLELIAWTVNEVADMQALTELGVHGIISDYVDRLQATLAP